MSARSRSSTVAAMCAILCVGIAAGADPANMCRSAKLLRAGTYDLCLVKTIARAERRGDAPDFTTCNEKLAAAWAKAEAKAGRACPTIGDLAAVRTHVRRSVDALSVLLNTTTTTTLPTLCGGAAHPACGGSCPAGHSCWAEAMALPTSCVCLLAVSTPCGDTGGMVIGAFTCGGACPAGEVCSTLYVDDVTLSASCGCVPAGSTPCLGSGQPACGGSCPAGLACASDPNGLFQCKCQ